jgi:hypothetical protein
MSIAFVRVCYWPGEHHPAGVQQQLQQQQQQQRSFLAHIHQLRLLNLSARQTLCPPKMFLRRQFVPIWSGTFAVNSE